MKVDSTTNKYSYSSIVDVEEDDNDDLLSMAGGLLGDDHSQSSGHRSEMRKSNKPIMEKRRRARINNCLNDLKNILLEAMKKDPARHSKLEKADILELTVRHLQNIQRNQLAIAMATDPTVLHRFKNGFSECVTEVNRYMGRMDGAEPGVRHRLLDHLGNCVNGLQQVGPTPFGSGPVPFPVANPCATFPGAVPPALGIHSSPPSVVAAAAAVSSLRHATSAPHLHPQPQHSISDDLNNNLLRHHQNHPSATIDATNATSARLMSAFAVASTLPRRLTPPSSPPPSLNISSSSHESISTTPSMFHMSSISSRNDSGLSDHSDLGSSSSELLSSSTRSSITRVSGLAGDPIDFSIGKVLKGDGNEEMNSRSSGNSVRVVKVEPMPSMPAPSPDECSTTPNKDMWRPW
ncbi:Protein deadpan [Orchesella cincta]|uniref:Protein deadpan n=1 Tax=Orchesella cincta TaxID=48709 RepID=A0A1D2NCK4_ORCCI|nr:Protein deadpan [Orchesella cincta]